MKTILTESPVSFRTKTKSRTIPADEFLITSELMRILKIKHKQTIYGLIKEGLPVIMVGRNFRFLKQEVIDFLKYRSRQRLKNSHKKSSSETSMK